MPDSSMRRESHDQHTPAFSEGKAMPRHPSSKPTDVELKILDVLWRRGPCTVRQVHDELSAERDTGYSTTLKMMQVMREKGLITRDDSLSPQLYRSAETKEQTQLGMLDDLTQRAFGGSAGSLVMRMISADRVSPEELEMMQELVKKAREENQ
jgi:predicted transcriptional regulator